MMINHGKILALNGWFFEHGISWVLFNQHWLVVWNMNFMTFHILGIIIPTDFHIFKRGRYTTNQNTVKFGFVQNWLITIDYTIKGNFGYRMIFDKAWTFDGFGVSMSVNPCKQNPWCFLFCFISVLRLGKTLMNEGPTDLLWSFTKSQDLSVRGPINLQQNRQMSFAKSPFLLLKSIEIPIFAKVSCLLVLKSGRIFPLVAWVRPCNVRIDSHTHERSHKKSMTS